MLANMKVAVQCYQYILFQSYSSHTILQLSYIIYEKNNIQTTMFDNNENNIIYTCKFFQESLTASMLPLFIFIIPTLTIVYLEVTAYIYFYI